MNEQYNASYSHILDISQKKISNLIKYIPLDANMDLMDFACGNGTLLAHVAGKTGSYTGIDTSADLINIAKECARRSGYEQARFICDDIVNYSNNNASTQDIGIAFDFSEHAPDKEWLNILVAIRKILRKSGKLILHTPNGKYFLEILKEKGFLKQFDGHIAIRSASENAQLLK